MLLGIVGGKEVVLQDKQVGKHRKTVARIDYKIDFKFTEGKVRIALREDEHGLKILGMRSYPQRKGLGRKALQLLKKKDIVGRPVNIMHKADKFWVKMRSEGLVK